MMFIVDELKNKEILKGMTISQNENSLIAVAKKELVVPEKKIVMMDDINEDEMKILKKIGCYKGGIIV